MRKWILPLVLCAALLGAPWPALQPAHAEQDKGGPVGQKVHLVLCGYSKGLASPTNFPIGILDSMDGTLTGFLQQQGVTLDVNGKATFVPYTSIYYLQVN